MQASTNTDFFASIETNSLHSQESTVAEAVGMFPPFFDHSADEAAGGGMASDTDVVAALVMLRRHNAEQILRLPERMGVDRDGIVVRRVSHGFAVPVSSRDGQVTSPAPNVPEDKLGLARTDGNTVRVLCCAGFEGLRAHHPISQLNCT